MTAALVVFAVFAGLAAVVLAVGLTILYADGKFALPGTTMHRVMKERAEVTVLQARLEQEQLRIQLADAVESRRRALMPAGEE